MPEDFEVDLRFGGGLNTRKSPGDIHTAECSEGKNFGIILDDARFTRRRAFDLAGTATNVAAVKGFAQLVDATNDTISTLIQAGSTVYNWDGADSFVSVGTVNANARLRGTQQHNWSLGTPVVIITDLNLVQPVMKWDGTTFEPIAHNLSGDFFARYMQVAGERALYFNVKSGTATPHVLAGSAIGDYEALDVSTEGGDAAADDAWFLPAPDLVYINGTSEAFGLVVFSTRRGHIYKLTGNDGSDFVLKELWQNSGASGDEAMTAIGNDIAYGRPGRIEVLSATDKLGDIAVDDLTFQIADNVRDLDEWNLYYLSRYQKVYGFSPSHSTVYVLHKDFIDRRSQDIASRVAASGISPWSIYQTDHSIAFQPEAVMVMRDPRDGLENLFMGGPDGEVLRFEGTGGKDGGTTDVAVERLSKLIRLPSISQAYDIEGFIEYRKTSAQTLTITFEYAGTNIFNQVVNVALDSPSNFPAWGGSFHWGGSVYWGVPFKLRNARQKTNPAGTFSEFQIRLAISGSADFSIERILVKFTAIT